MYQTITSKEKFILYLKILVPILITQVGLFAMNFLDIMMSGRAGATDLAGVAIGSSLWIPVYTGLSGILLAVTPIVAQLIGGKKQHEIAYTVMQAVYLSIIIAIIVFIIGFFTLQPLVNAMDLEVRVHEIAYDYLIALSIGIIPLFIYTVLRSFMDALGETKMTMWITLTSLPINAILNYLLIFGKFGFPKLGGVGAGYATAITYWVILFITILIIQKQISFSQYNVFARFYAISVKKWKELLVIGVPIGLAIFFETSIFSAVTLLMSEYDTITIAAHQIALNFASFLYMIPLSISMALTICVGFEVGAKRTVDAKQYSIIGIGLALLLAIVTGIILFLYRDIIATIYSTDQAVIPLAQHFLLYAIFFQLSDAVGQPIQGALRGYKDVNISLILSLISFWVIGLPLGYVLAQYTSLDAFGYWIGLSSGLAVGAILLFVRLYLVQRNFHTIELLKGK
ncbi:MATE family efflux transporter [Bacillus suaedaesalsae]|uniref:Probable multidrug resistance protein NorM n=1 Tax=Bacillus suaedaesalsae TaxID=2810349 RepID=A0ABS2DLU4_9BACI|nr:MATE family efflux transporter [Bacillus suaedaesalsae]MBM6619439.1 MATE family efflux transporter [Bacillus suaedaesalsae]